MEDLMSVKLRNGVRIPMLGYSLEQASPDLKTVAQVAFDSGYRHFEVPSDLASLKQFGDVLKNWINIKGCDRQELFITLKITQLSDLRPVKGILANSLYHLQLDYVDSVLIPIDKCARVHAKNLHDLVREGQIRSHGVFSSGSLNINQMPSGKNDHQPHIAQVDSSCILQNGHDLIQDITTRGTCLTCAYITHNTKKENGFTDQSDYNQNGFENKITIPKNHGKTQEQITLRSFLERQIPAIVRCNNQEDIKDSFQIYTFKL